MKKSGFDLKNAIVAAVDILIALYLYMNLNSLLKDINVIKVPYRLFAFISYFGLGIILSVLSLAGLVNILKISENVIRILTISSAIILMFSGLFVISILPYE